MMTAPLEYIVEVPQYLPDYEKWLNRLGQRGWQLMAITSAEDHIFCRVRQSEQARRTPRAARGNTK